MASVAAVEEGPHRFEGLVVASEMAFMARVCGAGVFVHRAPKPQASFWVAGIWLVVMVSSPG